MAKVKHNKLIHFVLMSNTVLFGVAAGLIGYGWMKYSVFQADSAALQNTWWTLNEKLMLSTIALLLGGFFHSIVVLYPEYVRRDKEIRNNKKRANEFEIQALVDSLTGIHNRRFFDESLSAYLEEFRISGANLGLMLLDLDHFKNINDTHGHNVGDQVLRIVADKLKSCSRQHDVVARIGGEEFAVITRCTDKEQLSKIADRYRDTVAQTTVWHENTAIRTTVSVGIATNEDSMNPEELFKIADIRLYQAKKCGRNQIAA